MAERAASRYSVRIVDVRAKTPAWGRLGSVLSELASMRDPVNVGGDTASAQKSPPTRRVEIVDDQTATVAVAFDRYMDSAEKLTKAIREALDVLDVATFRDRWIENSTETQG